MATLTCNKATDLAVFLFGEGGNIKVRSAYSTLLVVEDGWMKKQELTGRFTFRHWINNASVPAEMNILPDWGQSFISSLRHYENNDVVQFLISSLSIRGSDYLSFLHDGAAISLIEFLLSGHDNLNGSEEDDVLLGYAGDDNIQGFGGDDYMAGGGGSDKYWIDSDSDIVVETRGEDFEIDTVYSTIDYILPINIESLVLEGSAKYATGNNQRNRIVGNKGENILDGGENEDIMDGGDGGDTYMIDNENDQIIELASSAGQTTDVAIASRNDIAIASCNYVLPSNVEDLYLIGAEHLSGSGNDSANKLVGNIGNNKLNGWKGVDTMEGGLGDDTYIVEEIEDIIKEDLNSGVDSIISSVSLSLPENVENLTLVGDLAIDAIGNDADNVITGSRSSNSLKGKKGNDIYYVSSNDVVYEIDGEGYDTIYADATYITPVNIEKLILIGNENLSAFGNAQKNELLGNSGNNVIDGKEGSDTMKGGDGDDIYYVDNGGDAIEEFREEGIDTAISLVNYRIPSQVEKLVLSGKSDLIGWGNILDNTLSGNDGKNILYGGNGNDTYYISNGDLVVEMSDDGIDIIYTDITYELPSHIESLTLTGSAKLNGFGNSLNNKISGNSGSNILAGGQGDDIYYVDERDTVLEIDGEGVDTVYSMVTHELREFTENLILTGKKDANGIGNRHNNYIAGNDSTNILLGKSGDDIYIIDKYDSVVELEDDGFDTIIINDTYTLPINVECLVLSGSQNINAFGNEIVNKLTGNDGNNLIDGGFGADMMTGLSGNDSYIVTEGDLIIEYEEGGFDIAYSKSSWMLADNVEGLVLLGRNDIDGKGNSGNNKLTGNQGINRLYGGEGDDTYTIGIGDLVIENKGEGFDTVITRTSYNANDYIERIYLLGTANANITGNDEDNIIKGNLGINKCLGGLGNDIYIISSNDIVIEYNKEGMDTIESVQSVVLPEHVENIVLRGSQNINGTGNSEHNVIKGNFGQNKLAGGLGDDIYFIGAGDIIVEAIDSGSDSVISDCTYQLEDHLENLTLIGTRHINGTGNSLSNILTGNAGKNCLIGGEGKDILTGGLGADLFSYESIDDSPVISSRRGDSTVMHKELYSLESLDVITDFRVVEGDRLDLRNIDANMSIEGDQSFKFIGIRPFTGIAGELKFTRFENSIESKTSLLVGADINGDRITDFAVILQGINQMQANWILL